MITVTFLYPNAPGSRFDADYYIDVHMPLAIRLLGPALKAVTAEIGTSAAMPDSRRRSSPWQHFPSNPCRPSPRL
jgi:hypothetical protein